MDKLFTPLFPEFQKETIITGSSQIHIAEKEWRVRKNEIRLVINKFLNQRTKAYLAYDALTLERAAQLKQIKESLKAAENSDSVSYIRKLTVIVESCLLILPDQNSQSWTNRFTTIQNYCSRFIQKIEKQYS